MSSVIKSVSEQSQNEYIIYDAQLAGQLSPQWFNPEYWQRQGQLQAVSAGRGQAWFIQQQDKDYVLRHYRRGGMAAKISADRYLWMSLSSTRAWREYQLLVKLQQLGLPAPRPVAARVVRHGWFYSADILTHKIADSQPLSHVLLQQPLSDSTWQLIGKCIRAFHRQHIYHADLNAHNILLDGSGRIFLIDFDKSRVDQDTSWHQRTLQRLLRSLRKLQGQDTNFHFCETDWHALLTGYNS